MTIEEKAKRYDEAIERAKEINREHAKKGFKPSDDVLYIFPELKESNEGDDEKLREQVVYAINQLHVCECTKNKLLAYLEKLVKNVETKFKVGDWLVQNERKHIVKVVNATPLVYKVVDILGYHHTITNTAIENNYHLWTIQDAKDGDVLCDYCEGYDNPLIFILKKFERVDFGLVKPSDYSSYCFLTAGDRQVFKEGQYHHKHNINPATKEQRGLLFQKMKEAGYEWDADKKELKKFEQKPTWSEEDDAKLKSILFHIEDVENKDVIDWLNSLKDRVQPKQELKQENTDDLTNFESAMMHIGDSFFGQHAGLDPNDTNAIKEQANLLLELVPKQEWSEEDEYCRHQLIVFCENCMQHDSGAIRCANWLKSLKNRYTWKPSDEQMLAINTAINVVGKGTINGKYLVELHEQLKKLREE